MKGISVSLPRWSDCVRYEEGDPQVLQALQGGYPRFVLHPLVLKLSDWVARTNGTLSSLLFNSAGDGERAKTFVLNGLSSSFNNHKSAHQMASLVELIVEPGFSLQALLCHEPDAAFLAKEFWQHTGTGISTRLAEYALQVLGIDDAKKDKVSINWTNDALVKETLCSRIAGILNEANESRATESHRCFSLFNSRSSPKRNSSINQVTISSKDIHLFPSGMAAIYTAHQLAMRLFPSRKSVQFGFPYVDTLKLQQKMGPGVSFYGNGSSLDLDELTLKLQKGETISAVFCEFPSNPLFKTPDLVRLSKLAKEFGCLLIVDDTLASFANVSVLECADMVVSSLTKMFSGAANVMAGRCAFPMYQCTL